MRSLRGPRRGYMSNYQPESSGDRPIQPTPGQGFPPPPQYPGYQTGPVPQQPGHQTGPPPQQPGYQTGPVPQQPYPTQPYPPNAGPGYPPPGPGATYGPYPSEYLAAGPGFPPGPPPPVAPRPRRRGALWVAVGAATVVALGAASVAAYTLMSGSGTTLDKKVPADTVAYAEVNLDPPAGQKVAALRYLKHFPGVTVREDANTLLDGLLEEIFPNAEDRQKFVQNVQPWLGKHVAVAGDPQGDKVQAVVVAETTDAKAVGGDGGVITGWASLAEAAKYIPQASGTDVNLDQLKGTRIALSLHFTDTVADLTVKTFGAKPPRSAGGVGDRVGRLPDDTAVAVGISGGDQLVRQAYDAMKKAGLAEELDDALRGYDLRVPDDLAILVGSQTVVAVAGDANNPVFGVVTKTSDPARAKTVAERLLSKADSDVTVVQQRTPDGLALASSQDYLSKLVAGQGGLGNSDRFRKAVPDAGSSQYVIYVDVQRVIALAGEEDVPADVRPVQSVGFTASSQGDTSTMHLRVIVG